MLDSKLIEETAAPDADTTDSRRRYYRLTREGRRVLGEEAHRLERIVEVARAKSVLGEAS
jgi:DNA-binding PadR family transcriptional regulator